MGPRAEKETVWLSAASVLAKFTAQPVTIRVCSFYRSLRGSRESRELAARGQASSARVSGCTVRM